MSTPIPPQSSAPHSDASATSFPTSSSLDGRSGVRNGPFVTTGQGSLSIGGSLTVNVNDNSSNISGTNVTILSGEDEVKALKAQRQPRTAK